MTGRVTCELCGLARGNSLGVRISKYPLVRGVKISGRWTSRCIGSLPICDRCLLERRLVKDVYRGLPAVGSR